MLVLWEECWTSAQVSPESPPSIALQLAEWLLLVVFGAQLQQRVALSLGDIYVRCFTGCLRKVPVKVNVMICSLQKPVHPFPARHEH
jgi:hypothetical protein